MDANLVLTQITAGAGCAYILQLLQKWEKLPWVTAHTTVINHAIRAVMSGAAVLGISSAWSPSTGGGHVLTITIPSAIVILHGAWTWFGQFALTHGFSQLLTIPSGNVGEGVPKP
jgi:hypothetical protein